MSGKPKLVIGANGFLGSHVTRQLVADGAQVRAMVRAGANTRGIDDLSLTRFHGDVFDTAVLSEAMDGVDDVYYCVVDTRAWLRDTSPLFRTNVEGLRNVLDVAVTQPELRKFIFTSTYATVGRRRGHVATEDDVIGTRGLSDYVKSRVQAENLVMRYVAEAGLPAVAMCVSTTYGSGDWGRTPHGAFIAGAVFGKLPFTMEGIQLEVVGVTDAAKAMVLAADRGRVGERYLISERMIAKRGGADRRRRSRGAATAALDLRPDAVCPWRTGRSARPAHRQGRRTQPRLGANDARRGARRPQQGRPRTRLAATPGRGVHSRGGAVLGGDAKCQGQERDSPLNTTPITV